jgi:hypothetical protein
MLFVGLAFKYVCFLKTSGSAFHRYNSPAIRFKPMKNRALHSDQVYLTQEQWGWVK